MALSLGFVFLERFSQTVKYVFFYRSSHKVNFNFFQVYQSVLTSQFILY